MRYFLITYVRRPNGKIDETTEVVNKLRRRDIQMANVILDFKDQRVLAATVDGNVVDKDWDKIHNYFHQHYPAIFERLHKENGRVPIPVNNEPESMAEAAPPTY